MKPNFMRWYDRIPLPEKDLPLIPFNTELYTPLEILKEVRGGTALGVKLQARVLQHLIPDSPTLRRVAKARLVKHLSGEPREATFTRYRLGQKTRFTPKELISEIERETEVGLQFIVSEERHIKELY